MTLVGIGPQMEPTGTEAKAMHLFETASCACLPDIKPELRSGIGTAERSVDAHRALMRDIPALHQVEIGGELIANGPLQPRLTVAAWAMQRCFFPEQSADLLRTLAPDLVLVSQMDIGMARTHQRHTTRALADSLGMRYCFGLEFFETGLGNAVERRLAADSRNEKGWHGNAILSRVDPERVALIRLDASGASFTAPHDAGPEETEGSRIGGSCAVAATFSTAIGPICAVSTRLASIHAPTQRLAMLERLIAALDMFAIDHPIIIGGDFGTLSDLHGPDKDLEPLFRTALRHGYSWDNNASGTTTRPNSRSVGLEDRRHQDWFCVRGFASGGARIVPGLDRSGKALSDHDVILGTFDQIRTVQDRDFPDATHSS